MSPPALTNMPFRIRINYRGELIPSGMSVSFPRSKVSDNRVQIARPRHNIFGSSFARTGGCLSLNWAACHYCTNRISHMLGPIWYLIANINMISWVINVGQARPYAWRYCRPSAINLGPKFGSTRRRNFHQDGPSGVAFCLGHVERIVHKMAPTQDYKLSCFTNPIWYRIDLALLAATR